MIFGDLRGLKLPDICLTSEEKPRKNLTQETCPDRGSNPGPLRDKRACYHLLHSGGLCDVGEATEGLENEALPHDWVASDTRVFVLTLME